MHYAWGTNGNHIISWVAENVQRSSDRKAKVPTRLLYDTYKEYCVKKNIQSPCINLMMGKVLAFLYGDVRITGNAYEGLRLVRPEERSCSKDLQVPKFCEWKIEDGNFSLRIPKPDVCDAEVVHFEYIVTGETGRMTLHVRKVEIDVEQLGFSRHVTLDQVWVNSVILIAEKAQLCKGYVDFSEVYAVGQQTSPVISVHEWKSRLSSETADTIARVHDHKCDILRKFTDTSSICYACSHGVHKVLKKGRSANERYLRKMNLMLEYPSDFHEDCDIKKPMKRIKTSYSSNETSNSNSLSQSTENSRDSPAIDMVETLMEFNEEDTVSLDPSVTVKMELEEDDAKTFSVYGQWNPDFVPDNNYFVPDNKEGGSDLKIKIEEDSMVFLPQVSMLKVHTVSELPSELSANTVLSEPSPVRTEECNNRKTRRNAKRKRSIDDKQKEKKKDDVYECVECKIKFKSEKAVAVHKLKNHSVEEKDKLKRNPFEKQIMRRCALCKMTLVQRQIHYEIMHNITDFQSREAQKLIKSLGEGKLPPKGKFLEKCALCEAVDVDARSHYISKHLKKVDVPRPKQKGPNPVNYSVLQGSKQKCATPVSSSVQQSPKQKGATPVSSSVQQRSKHKITTTVNSSVKQKGATLVSTIAQQLLNNVITTSAPESKVKIHSPKGLTIPPTPVPNPNKQSGTTNKMPEATVQKEEGTLVYSAPNEHTLASVPVICKLCGVGLNGVQEFLNHIYNKHKKVREDPFGYGIVE